MAQSTVMPDVWTSNPTTFRRTLEEAGLVCGVEPRVIKDRDREWTCIFDSKGWLRDIYIHPVGDLLSHRYFLAPLVIVAILGVFAGLLWGRSFWRTKERSTTR